MFADHITARADMKAGTLYAVAGEEGWTYYGQITSEKKVGFFRLRGREATEVSTVLLSPVMSVVSVAYPSITRALRSGRWKKLGRFALVDELVAPRHSVQWPVGTLRVTVWLGNAPSYETMVDDPDIQDMELMAVWDAEAHVPARLTADFGTEAAEWHVGGPIRRERKIKEELAARRPDLPHHRLPPGWTPTSVR